MYSSAPRPPCLADPLSVHGLRPMARDRPDWARLLLASRPRSFSLTAESTLSEGFRSGAFRRLYPLNDADLNRTYADRGAAKRVSGVFVRPSIGLFTEADLRAYGDGELDGTPNSAGTRERDVALLRAALHRFAKVAGVLCSLDARARPRPGRKNSPPRASQPDSILPVLAHASVPVRRAIALSLGAGATPAELVRLVLEDVVAWRDQQMLVLLGDEHRRRPVALPSWCVQVLVDGASADLWRQPGRPLIGLSEDALQRAVRAAVFSAGVQPGSVTLTRLRSAWQSMLALFDAPRAVVRGRWALPPRFRRRDVRHWPERAQRLFEPSLALASRWKVLSEPPGGWPEHALKRPSGRTRPWEPEVNNRPLRPLPPSVR